MHAIAAASRLAVKFALTSVLAGLCGASLARTDAAAVAAAGLPAQGRETMAAIRRGGPFAFEKDGTVFGNRERLLPAQERGYYREYTVAPPGARSRGAQRIVCGGPATAPHACWYTADHYASFRRIVE